MVTRPHNYFYTTFILFLWLAVPFLSSADVMLPEKDTGATGVPVKLRPEVAGKHPRLLITAEKIPQLRAFYNSEKAAVYRQQLLRDLPKCAVPENRKNTAMWGQQEGLINMPTVALHYVLTGDKNSLARCKEYLQWLAGTADWTQGGEPAVENTLEAYAKVMEVMKNYPPKHNRNSDTTAAFTMVGASLMWDWLYNDLDPDFREYFRQVLWQHARAMYHGGLLTRNGDNNWHDVAQYNHRYFRDWGITLAMLAATEGKPEEQWLLGQMQNELKFNTDWMAPDGSNHEGPGYGGVTGGLGMALQAFDECLGTRYLESPFYRNISMYAIQEATPGMKEAIYYADCQTHVVAIHPFYLKTASNVKNADIMDGIRQYLKATEKNWGINGWLSILCDDPNLQGGHYTKLPATYLFPDLGMSIVRESWQDNAVAAMFKCGPPGGYKLNAWRAATKTEGGRPPVVGHDHPDANSFVIFGDGDYLAETDRYPLKPGKLSSGKNTILINKIGQAPLGRPEGEEWLQPSSNDMTKMGVITAWKDVGDIVVTEGEASGSYEAYNKGKNTRPSLDRFRRDFIWVKGGYILVLDDIRAPQPVEITWLMQGAKLETVDEAQKIYKLSKNKANCNFQLLADTTFKTDMGVSTANDHNKLLKWQQLQASAEAKAMRFVSIYDPWHHQDLKLTFTPSGPDKATVTVTGKGIADKWEWESAKGKFTASTLHGSRQQGFDVRINAQTAAPPAHD